MSLSRDDLRDVCRQISNALWPEGDVDHEWSADTLDQIASILIANGLAPDAMYPPKEES